MRPNDVGLAKLVKSVHFAMAGKNWRIRALCHMAKYGNIQAKVPKTVIWGSGD